MLPQKGRLALVTSRTGHWIAQGRRCAFLHHAHVEKLLAQPQSQQCTENANVFEDRLPVPLGGGPDSLRPCFND
jgi:hypothetical protein